MAEDGDKRAALAARLADRFDRTLPVILIGNNVVNIGATSAATAMVTQMLGASGVAVATFIMTIVILVFGEVLPKSIAKENSEQVALFTSRPLSLFVVLLSPIAWLFTKLQEGFPSSADRAKTPSRSSPSRSCAASSRPARRKGCSMNSARS